MKTLSRSILILATVLLCTCSKNEFPAPEVSVFEYVFTNDSDGAVSRSSDVYGGMRRIDISENVYWENGLIWVKGAEAARNYDELMKQSVVECNEWLSRFGTMDYRSYSPTWNADSQTKSGNSVTKSDFLLYFMDELEKKVRRILWDPDPDHPYDVSLLIHQVLYDCILDYYGSPNLSLSQLVAFIINARITVDQSPWLDTEQKNQFDALCKELLTDILEFMFNQRAVSNMEEYSQDSVF
ncbi:MAG: hypothetical protein MJY50_03180 [Bacteroidales bacterium]|nr:hypothetical protein [Bacteroidales bacterium]